MEKIIAGLSEETYLKLKKIIEKYELEVKNTENNNVEQPYIEVITIVKEQKYNPKYGDDRICACGHPYYRHFDTYEQMYACGCKYCGCFTFVEENKENLFMNELSERIIKFIDTYAAISPNEDADKYTCPDAYQLLDCADLLSRQIKPTRCFSEWGCGGYKPYSSEEGRKEHDYLVSEIYKIINGK